MKIDAFIRLLAGTIVLTGVALTVFVSRWWLLLPTFAGLNLFQWALTGFCPPSLLLSKLGWLDRACLLAGEKVPHMGWADTLHTGHALFEGSGETPRFYYVHSYHLRCDDEDMVICTAKHGYRFTSGVARGNILGVQFHPEKSHVYGQQLLKNFT